MSSHNFSIPPSREISQTSTAKTSTTDLLSNTCNSMKRPSDSICSQTTNHESASQSQTTEDQAGECARDSGTYWEGKRQIREAQDNDGKLCCDNTETVVDGGKGQVFQEKSDDNDVSLDTKKVIFPPWKRQDKWSSWMSDTVTAKSLVFCLIMQAFATGILDATTYLDFQTFASNQTGNTILLTVAIVKSSGHLLLLTGVSFASFLGAALVFGHIGNFIGVRRRIWLLMNVTAQIIFLILSTIFLSSIGPIQTRLGEKHEWVIISLFATMSGAQVVSARQASIQEIPTAPMTSSYVDLVSDKYLFSGFKNKNSKSRNRRLSYILSMIIGSFIGGIMHKYAGSWIVVLVAIGFKLIVLALMCIAPSEILEKKDKGKISVC
ncbi:uncharacterized protein I206_100248 [Kwoniella pini CBS 10737]|uniref:DUF1275 domain-containing protein n=1 Tax=Kwoniella pini CBS 10737 TaxID=1296096 RepID=A0A1B9IEQ3_9TREE|nr:uncharacterized protein I206_01077 [Kwoniella pini CBS 10737]OCF53770.1 hypothetical protein I206_01077 [Kwoniella pini CBS 10737]